MSATALVPRVSGPGRAIVGRVGLGQERSGGRAVWRESLGSQQSCKHRWRRAGIAWRGHCQGLGWAARQAQQSVVVEYKFGDKRWTRAWTQGSLWGRALSGFFFFFLE